MAARVALIDNGTKYLAELRALLKDHEVRVFDFSEVGAITDVDLVVLSGGSQFPILGNEERLASEIELIRTTTIPTIGICYGAELIAYALGGTLVQLEEKVHGLVPIRVVADDLVFRGQKEFEAYEAHRVAIGEVPAELIVLAESVHGPEVLHHKTKPMWALQFHPEKTTDTSDGARIFNNVLASLYKHAGHPHPH